MIRNEIRGLMKSPYRNVLLLMVNDRELKSGLPPIAARIGVMKSLVNAVTRAPNAAPMSTATARSTTLPRRMNARKPFTASPLRSENVRFQEVLNQQDG